MKCDFYDAFSRHFEDAEYLRIGNRLANADHLYGLASECGLKRLMVCFGMPTHNGDPTDGKDKVHANKVWSRYETYRSSHTAQDYALPTPNPFDDWDISERYAHRRNFNTQRL